MEEILEEMIKVPELKNKVADEFIDAFKLGNAERYIRARFKKNEALPWGTALHAVLRDIQHAKHVRALTEAVRKHLMEIAASVEEEQQAE